MLRGIYAILILDLKRFWLDRTRLLAGMVQPLLYLFVLGAGLGASSQLGNSYRPFIFPGVMGLSLLFAATFAAIVIVFDRQIGFFKAVLVAPVPRTAIAVGKIISGAVQAFVQGVVVLPFAPLAGVHLTFLSVLAALGGMALASLAFSAIGVAVASRFRSTTVFPIVSNGLLLPMFFLSGALYPLDIAPRWMVVAAHADPVAYAVDLIRRALIVEAHPFTAHAWVEILVLIGVIIVLAALAVQVFRRGEDDSSLGAAHFRRGR